MEGGYKESEISSEDKKNILNAEISELERRKRNLAKEVEDYYRAYKNKLDLDYNIRLGKIEKTDAQREIDFKKREDNLHKRENFIESQASSGVAEIKTKLDLAQQKIKEASESSANYAKLSEDINADYQTKNTLLAEELYKTRQEREDLAKEKIVIKEIQDRLSLLEKQNQETQRRLEVALKDAEGRQSYLIYWESEIKKKEEQNARITESLAEQKLDFDNRKTEITNNEEKTNKLLSQAQQLLKENQAQQAILKKLIVDNKQAGETLADWRDGLDERERSANEKDRYYILREREIDAKIRILNKLREEKL